MDDLKQAYKVLGLKEHASKEEVEKRYSTLVRREKARSKSGDRAGDEEFRQVTVAYRLILAREDEKFTQAFNEKEYGKYKNMAGKAQKLDHFWRYYKIHTLGAIALIGIIIYGIMSYIDHKEHERYLASLPPIDLQVTFMGTFMEENGQEKDLVMNTLMEPFPEWKRLEYSTIFVPQDEMNRYAYLQKALVTVMAEIPDLYLMDKYMFEWLGPQGALLPLDDRPELSAYADGPAALELKTEDDPEGSVYGLDLSKSDLFKDLPMMKVELIAAVRTNAERPDNAVKFIEHYAKTIPSP
ncbi:J domain-containing protein [Paenibacillus sp. 1011MAR3C5]|uniref:J domain-containing protein n=1 Tax=Paenibacillus sp. 1011MAR3C5 TaxID=1675787 RepID=UPI000E6B7CA8|nr:J domain-containing protein [Paenibacillus sp. 1011MAR3C5]RJE89757.1 J domain-containing protein [Paenibacillus sp. 1011MAR3C5]